MFLLNLPSSSLSLTQTFQQCLFIAGLLGEILLTCNVNYFWDLEYVCGMGGMEDRGGGGRGGSRSLTL